MAESKRVPFDLPEGESELIAGYFTEYSGGKQAVFMLVDFAEIVLVCALITTFFFGGWQFPWLYPDGFHLPGGAFHAAAQSRGRDYRPVDLHRKLVAFLLAADPVRWTLPRFRYDQLMRLGWKGLLPVGLANVVVTACVIVLGESRMPLWLFIFLAALPIISAPGVVLQRNPVHSLMSLVLTLVVIGMLFIGLGATTVGFLQMIVYAGAIMILFLFVIWLLNLQTQPLESGRLALKFLGALGTAVLIAELHVRAPCALAAGLSLSSRITDRLRLAQSLFSDYLVAFEVTSVLLLVGVVGAVALARRPDAPRRVRAAIPESGRTPVMVPASYFMGLSAILFCIGVAGVLLRRNAIIIFMSIELMLNAVNLAFVALSRAWGSVDGQSIVFFVMTVAAAESAIGLGIILPSSATVKRSTRMKST